MCRPGLPLRRQSFLVWHSGSGGGGGAAGSGGAGATAAGGISLSPTSEGL